MTVRIIVLNLAFLCLSLLLLAGGVSADPVAAYFQARQAAPQPLLSASQLSDVLHHPGSYAGRTLDIAVLVSGLVTAGEDRTALLSAGAESVPCRCRAV